LSEEVRFLLVHHTASANDYEADDVPGLLQGFYQYHTSADKGWPDIAYNFLIDRFGRIWEGREGSVDGPVAGDATGGNQGYSQLCCLIGDFTSELPTPEALDSLALTLAWLADRYHLETEPGTTVSFVSRGSNRWPEGTEVETPTVSGHRDMSLTECPGDALYAHVIGGLAADVTAVRAVVATSTTPTTVSTSTTVALVESTTTTSLQATGPTTIRPALTSSTSIPVAQSEGSSNEGDLPRGLLGLGLAAGVTASVLAVRRSRESARSKGRSPDASREAGED
jgi:hypothetical protein